MWRESTGLFPLRADLSSATNVTIADLGGPCDCRPRVDLDMAFLEIQREPLRDFLGRQQCSPIDLGKVRRSLVEHERELPSLLIFTWADPGNPVNARRVGLQIVLSRQKTVAPEADPPELVDAVELTAYSVFEIAPVALFVHVHPLIAPINTILAIVPVISQPVNPGASICEAAIRTVKPGQVSVNRIWAAVNSAPVAVKNVQAPLKNV